MSAAVDPLGSLKSWELEVELGNHFYVIPAAPASVWLPILLDDPFDITEIMPGMLSDNDADILTEALIEGRLTSREVTDAALDVVSMAAGRPWWWALRLLNVAAASWHTVWGDLMSRGLAPQALPLGAVLDAMYLVIASRLKDEVRRQLDRDLEMPPPGQAPEIDENREAAAFLAMMNQGV